MRKVFCIGMILCCCVGHAEAQKIDDDLLIDSIKADITRFFTKEGLLDKQKVKDSRNYVFATEIKQKRSIGYDLNGIYRIGIHQSHSPERVLIKEGNEFKIFDLEEISKLLKEVISYSERSNVDVEMMLTYLKEVMGMYQDNHHIGNFKLSKAQ